MSWSWVMMSPRLMPMRNSIRRSGGMPALRSAIARCISTAQCAASTTLANSTRKPSPVVLTMRPRCSLIRGSAISRRHTLSAASGARLFPATLVLPQIAPGDEFYVWADTLPQTPAGDGTGTRKSNFTAVYAKTITDRLGIVVEEGWTRLDRVGHGSWSAMQNLATEIKYLAIDDQPHEFLLTLGLDREWGGTGAQRVGA